MDIVRSWRGIAARWVSATGEDLVSILPGPVRRRLVRPARSVHLSRPSSDACIEALLPDGRRWTVGDEHGQAALRDAARRHVVILHVPDDDVLSTVLRLPRRATLRLDEVVATNVSVWTPFAPEDVYIKARVRPEDAPRPDGRRHVITSVEVRLTPRAAVAPLIALCKTHALDVDEVWLGPDRTLSVSLGSPKALRWRRTRRWCLALAGLAALQCVVLIVLLGMRQDDQREALEERLAQIRATVHARATRLEAAKAAARTLAEVRSRAAGRASVTRALLVLAKALPPGVGYREVSLTPATGGAVTIVAKDRIDPVALIAASRMFAVTEVNERGGLRDDEHLYAVAFKVLPARADIP